MPFVQPPKLYENQADVLGELLTDNPYLIASKIPTKHKALNTTKKFIIGAINEIAGLVASMSKTVIDTLQQFSNVIGSFNNNPQLVTDLHKIDASILEALISMYKDVAGDLDNPKDISAIAPSVKEAILKLNADRIAAERVVDFKDVFVTTGPDPVHSFLLTRVPDESSIKLCVNGIFYEGLYDPVTRVMEWTFTKANGGFDLTENYAVVIIYDYLLSENI